MYIYVITHIIMLLETKWSCTPCLSFLDTILFYTNIVFMTKDRFKQTISTDGPEYSGCSMY